MILSNGLDKAGLKSHINTMSKQVAVLTGGRKLRLKKQTAQLRRDQIAHDKYMAGYRPFLLAPKEAK